MHPRSTVTAVKHYNILLNMALGSALCGHFVYKDALNCSCSINSKHLDALGWGEERAANLSLSPKRDLKGKSRRYVYIRPFSLLVSSSKPEPSALLLDKWQRQQFRFATSSIEMHWMGDISSAFLLFFSHQQKADAIYLCIQHYQRT